MKKIIFIGLILLNLISINLQAVRWSNNIFAYKHEATKVGWPTAKPINNWENAFTPI